MPTPRPLTELQDRKRLLVLRADLHRALLQAECTNIRERLRWVNETRDKMQSASPWLIVGAGALGLLIASRWRKLSKWVPGALAAWRTVQHWKAGLDEFRKDPPFTGAGRGHTTYEKRPTGRQNYGKTN